MVDEYQDLIKGEAEFWERHYGAEGYASFAHEVPYIRTDLRNMLHATCLIAT